MSAHRDILENLRLSDVVEHSGKIGVPRLALIRIAGALWPLRDELNGLSPRNRPTARRTGEIEMIVEAAAVLAREAAIGEFGK